MAAKTGWHRYGTKLRHCHPMSEMDVGPFFFTQPNPTHGWTKPMYYADRHSVLPLMYSWWVTCVSVVDRGPRISHV